MSSCGPVKLYLISDGLFLYPLMIPESGPVVCSVSCLSEDAVDVVLL